MQWPKGFFAFLSKNKTYVSFSPRKLLNNVFTTTFCYFLGNFLIPSSQNIFFKYLFIFGCVGSQLQHAGFCLVVDMTHWLLCSMWDLSFQTRDWIRIPLIGMLILNHWTTRAIPYYLLNYFWANSCSRWLSQSSRELKFCFVCLFVCFCPLREFCKYLPESSPSGSREFKAGTESASGKGLFN